MSLLKHHVTKLLNEVAACYFISKCSVIFNTDQQLIYHLKNSGLMLNVKQNSIDKTAK